MYNANYDQNQSTEPQCILKPLDYMILLDCNIFFTTFYNSYMISATLSGNKTTLLLLKDILPTTNVSTFIINNQEIY